MLKYTIVVLLVISGTALGASRQRRAESDECQCEPINRCDIKPVVGEPTIEIDIREGEGDCLHYLDKCCNKTITPLVPPVYKHKGCGHANSAGFLIRIVGNNIGESQFAEFPWVVAVLDDANNGDYKCAGSLIHPKVILTGAHCVSGKKLSTLKIRAGEWDTQTENEPLPHQERSVSQVIIHEGYSYVDYLKNDFALVIVSEEFKLAKNVDTICLPAPNSDFDEKRCVVAGWGKNVFGKEGVYQVIMKKIEVPVVPHDSCQTSLQATRLGKNFSLEKSLICAGGEAGKDACKGDGGAPLFCALDADPERFEQAGIVAWGIGCGQNGIPGVYAKVANAREWIDEKMKSLKFDISQYTVQL